MRRILNESVYSQASRTLVAVLVFFALLKSIVETLPIDPSYTGTMRLCCAHDKIIKLRPLSRVLVSSSQLRLFIDGELCDETYTEDAFSQQGDSFGLVKPDGGYYRHWEISLFALTHKPDPANISLSRCNALN